MLRMRMKNIQTNFPATRGAGKANEGGVYRYFGSDEPYILSLTPFAQIALSTTLERALSTTLERARGKKVDLREMQKQYHESVKKQVRNVIDYCMKVRA